MRGLLGHLVGVVRRVAAMGRGDRPDARHAPSIEGRRRRRRAGRAWRAAVDDADNAWRDDSALERTVVLPWATDSGANALLGYVSEITVHTWDVAQATGQRPEWDDETAEHALRLMHQWLPGEHRAEIFAEVRNQMGLAPTRTRRVRRGRARSRRRAVHRPARRVERPSTVNADLPGHGPHQSWSA